MAFIFVYKSTDNWGAPLDQPQASQGWDDWNWMSVIVDSKMEIQLQGGAPVR